MISYWLLSPLSSTLWCIIPCVFNQTHSMTFLTNLLGFGVPCGTWSCSKHCNPRWILSNAIPFSSLVRMSRKCSIYWTWRALTDRWPYAWSCDFRSVLKKSIFLAWTPFRCHVMLWLLFAGRIQTRLQIHGLLLPNQRLHQPKKIDDRGFYGVTRADPEVTGRLLRVWQTTVCKSAQSWHPLDIIGL